MPTYEYHCPDCATSRDVEAATPPKQAPPCQTCGKRTERVYSAPTVQYTGSGWACKDGVTKQ